LYLTTREISHKNRDDSLPGIAVIIKKAIFLLLLPEYAQIPPFSREGCQRVPGHDLTKNRVKYGPGVNKLMFGVSDLGFLWGYSGNQGCFWAFR
jgi:hypothetical protein